MRIKTYYDDKRERLIIYKNGFPIQTFYVNIDVAYQQYPLLLEAFRDE